MRRLRLETLEPRYALAAGELDLTFGGTGFVETRFDSTMPAYDAADLIARLPDGKVIVAGNSRPDLAPIFMLVRLHEDGTLDETFGEGGKVLTSFPGYAQPRAIAIQPDGKILLADDTRRFVRYLPDGTLDSSFGDNGFVSLGGMPVKVQSIAVQADGRIFVAVSKNGDVFGMQLIRLEANGTVDPAFVPLDIGSDSHESQHADVIASSDGGIFAASTYLVFDPTEEIFYQEVTLRKLRSDGAADLSFSDEGIVVLRYERGGSFIRGFINLNLQADGRVLLNVFLADSTGPLPTLLRFNPDGSFDSSFGAGDGRVIIDFHNAGQELRELYVHSDGTIYFGGNHYVARLLSNGALDASWGADGIWHNSEYVSSDFLESCFVLRADGGLLWAGSMTGLRTDLAVAAYDEFGQLDSAFGNNGIVTVDSGMRENTAGPPIIRAGRDGGVTVSSFASHGYWRDQVFRRYLPTGEADRNFGGDGEIWLSEFIDSRPTLVDFITLADGGLIACLMSHVGSRHVELLKLRPDGSLDMSFGVQGFAAASYADMPIVPLSLSLDQNGNVLVAGYVQNQVSGDLTPDIVMRFTADGQIDASYGEAGTAFHPALAISFVRATLATSHLSDGSVYLFRRDGERLLVRHIGPDGILSGEKYLETTPRAGASSLVIESATVLPSGTLQVVGIENYRDMGASFTGTTIIQRFNLDGTPDLTFGNQSYVAIELPPALAETPKVLTRSDGTTWVATSAADWPRGNFDIFITQITPQGMIDSTFGQNGNFQLAVHEYDEEVDSLALLRDGIVFAGTTQSGVSRNLLVGRVAIDAMPSPWQNPTNPLNVSGDPLGEIHPIDALIIINALNDTAAGGPRELGARLGTDTYYYDVNGDGWVTALDALIVINWLNQNPALPAIEAGEVVAAEGEGELPPEEVETSLWDFREPAERLDGAAVALLMSSLEADQKRR